MCRRYNINLFSESIKVLYQHFIVVEIQHNTCKFRHFCVPVLHQDQDSQYHLSSSFCCLMDWSERWLFIVLILEEWLTTTFFKLSFHIVVGSYFSKLAKQVAKRTFGELVRSVSQRVQLKFISTDSVRLLCLFCNVKIPKTAKLYWKEQKQSF